jgi:hypothetical protein
MDYKGVSVYTLMLHFYLRTSNYLATSKEFDERLYKFGISKYTKRPINASRHFRKPLKEK